MPMTHRPLLSHPLSQLLLPALAYYLAGRFGLLLAIPPGFASAVWPAAGVALTFALLRPGIPTLAGIAAGSFAVNVGVVSHLVQLDPGALLTPALIATGAMAQAAAGAWLYRRWLGHISAPDTPRAISRFLLVAPLSCLIAASIAVVTLYGRGIVGAGNIAFTWSTWWVGDSIGLLLFTPLLLGLAASPAQLSLTRKLQVLVPSLVLFLCVTLLFVFSTDSRRRQLEAGIEADSLALFQQLEQTFDHARQKLAAHQALFISQAEVSWPQFEAFSEAMRANDRSLYSVGWTPRLAHAGRDQLEADSRAQGLANFQLRELNPQGQLVPAHPRPVYYPVQFIYPLAANDRVLGYDLGHSAERLATLERAAHSRRAAATPPITLVQDRQPRSGLLMYLPVFDARDEIRGYISGVFRIAQLLEPIAQQARAKHYAIALTDISQADQPLPLSGIDQLPMTSFAPRHFEIDFGGRTLRASFFADENYLLASKDWTSWSILTLGFFIAGLLQAFLLLLTGTNERIGREVVHKTRELASAVHSAQVANQAKTNFLANMSHELRTPLHAVTGLINRCRKTPLQPDQQDYLEKASLAAGTLMSLINHTLDLSKIEAGQLTLEQVPFSLRQLLDKIAAIFSYEAEDKQLAFRLHVDPVLPDALLGDPLRIEQILLNLCGNALKFTHQGQVCLTVRRLAQAQQPWAEFEVSDTGIGISADKQQQLFKAFAQADSSTTRQYGGTGLGLAISKNLVQLMGGSIAIDSNPGRGTRLTVRLPLQLAEPQAPAQSALTPTGPDAQALAGRHLLLVEDIAINRELARYMLEDQGARVTCADNGRHALEQLAAHADIDLVLMDIQMPEMDGYQATAAIRAQPRYKDLPIIAMTANAVASDIAACRAAGMDDHVGKPIDEAVLMEAIGRQLRKRDRSEHTASLAP